MNNNKLYRKAFLAYGAAAQIRKAQEECGELITAASKLLDDPNNQVVDGLPG